MPPPQRLANCIPHLPLLTTSLWRGQSSDSKSRESASSLVTALQWRAASSACGIFLSRIYIIVDCCIMIINITWWSQDTHAIACARATGIIWYFKKSSIPAEGVAFAHEPKCENVSRQPSFVRVSTWFGQTFKEISDLKFATENINAPWN